MDRPKNISIPSKNKDKKKKTKTQQAKKRSSSVDPNQPKRKPGRPRQYPDLTPQQVTELKRNQKAEAIAKRLQEQNSPTVRIKGASIERIVGLPIPGIDLHEIEKNCEGPEVGNWANASVARRQEMRDSIHQDPHFYIIAVPQDEGESMHSKITWIKRISYPNDPPEFKPPPYDPSNPDEPLRPNRVGLYRYYKIGPCILPFASPHYVFDLTIERRPADATYKTSKWNDLTRALLELPRRVYIESLSVDVKASFEVWPPTAGHLVRIIKHGCYGSGVLMEKHLLGSKLQDYRMKSVRMNDPKYHYQWHDVKSRTPYVTRNTVIDSFERLEYLLFGYAREALGFNPRDDNESDLHLLYERCVWLLREYFLGAEYFNAFNYFHALELVGQTPDRINTLLVDILDDTERKPKRTASLILNKFLRPDRVGVKFRNGACLLRFINEHVKNEEVLELILPEFADLDSFGAPRDATAAKPAKKSHKSPVKRPGTVSGPLTVSPSPFIIRNPSSFDAVADWYDCLRKLYADVVAGPFSTIGDLFPSSTILPEQVEYMEYLIERGFIEVYHNLQEASLEQRVVEKHFDLQTRKDSIPVLVPSPCSQSSSCSSDEASFAEELEAEMHEMQKRGYMSMIVKEFLVMTEDSRFAPRHVTVFATTTSFDDSARHLRHKASSTRACEDSDDECSSSNYADVQWVSGGDDIFGHAVKIDDLYSNSKPATKKSRVVSIIEGAPASPMPSMIVPSASGAREPLVIYPKVAAEMSQAVTENILSMITERFEEHLQRNFSTMISNACHVAGQARLQQPRSALSAEESAFLDSARSCLASYDFFGNDAEIVMSKIKSTLMEYSVTRDFKFMTEIFVEPTRPTRFGGNLKYNAPFLRRVNHTSNSDAFTKQVVLEGLDYPIVLVDYPFSYAERKSSGQDLLDSVSYISDYNIGPEELHLLPYFTVDTLFAKRSSSQDRLLVLKEVEKWPIQHLKEVLQTLFYNWRGTGMVQGACALWVFADFHALDVGALSVLTHFAKGKPHLKHISLRNHLVKDSLVASLAAQVQLSEACQIQGDDIDGYLVFSKTDETEITQEWFETDPVRGEVLVHSQNVPIVQLSMDTLYRYRDPTKRPRYAKVQLSSISDWRQLYTITCYVSDLLILVGTERMLQHIYSNSVSDFQVYYDPEADPDRKDVVAVSKSPGQDPLKGYVRYRPEGVMDIWSSMRTVSPASSETSGNAVHL